MAPLILCRERLERIQHILKRAAGEAVSVRDFVRTHSVRDWELNQAAELGWVEITLRKPPTGRPSSVVTAAAVNKSGAAKLPPPGGIFPGASVTGT